MAARSDARARTQQRPGAGRPAPQRPRVLPGGGRQIRWDRVGRVGLLVVLLGVIALYVGPTISFVETIGENKARTAELQELKQENRKLRERRAGLKDPEVLEREARRLGMVKPGERPYIVKGLPAD